MITCQSLSLSSRTVWSKLKPGGHMVLNMTNYAFWVKALVNRLTGKQLFKNEHEHFCVHSPASLDAEIRSFVPDAERVVCDSDFVYIPNLPKKVAFLYINQPFIKFLNDLTRLLLHHIFRMRERGSIMTLVFRKPDQS
jgi:hypothetical protein